MNPLLDRSHSNSLIDFAALRPEHIQPAIDQLLGAAQAALETACQTSTPANWRQLSLILDAATEKLGVAWGAVSHLNSVADTAELRSVFNAMLPLVTSFYSALGADERLYAKYKAISQEPLSEEQQQALRNALRSFQLGGADLKGDQKKRYSEIDERLSALSQKFSENLLDSTEAFTYVASQAEMEGIPLDVQRAAQDRFEALDENSPLRSDLDLGFVLTLKAPCYLPVMQYAKRSDLREKLYKAYQTRASDLGDPAFDNTATIGEILSLRHEQAQLLGYPNYAFVSLAPKMADTPAEVISFLRDLASRAKPFALQDVSDLRSFAKSKLGISDPAPWDWTFISERLKEELYSYSEAEVKNFFQLPRVLLGLFAKIESLFGVRITKDNAPTWNDKVQFFRVTQNNQLLAQFYLDTIARTGKRGGAWMDDARGRWMRPLADGTSELQTPIAHLVCNFADGVDKKPALLSHDDVITLFHEFGHGLHHMLTKVNEYAVAGINGVEWDAVELPSQMMENFCWEWQTIESMSSHVDSGLAMPRALFDKMLAAKNFQSGLGTLRQVEFSLFDLLLHSTEFSAPLDLLADIRKETGVLPSPNFNRMPHSFSHVFAGGYAAGYYSYKWAEVLSADCYAAFEEAAAIGHEAVIRTGQMYLSEILVRGGSRPAIESFIAFRGRKPQIDALLRHSGMAKH